MDLYHQFIWDIKLILSMHCQCAFLKLKKKLKSGVGEGCLTEAVSQQAQVPGLPGIFL